MFEFGRAIEALDVEGQQVGDCVCFPYVFFEDFVVEHEEVDRLRSHLLALHHALQRRPPRFREQIAAEPSLLEQVDDDVGHAGDEVAELEQVDQFGQDYPGEHARVEVLQHSRESLQEFELLLVLVAADLVEVFDRDERAVVHPLARQHLSDAPPQTPLPIQHSSQQLPQLYCVAALRNHSRAGQLLEFRRILLELAFVRKGYLFVFLMDEFHYPHDEYS